MKPSEQKRQQYREQVDMFHKHIQALTLANKVNRAVKVKRCIQFNEKG